MNWENVIYLTRNKWIHWCTYFLNKYNVKIRFGFICQLGCESLEPAFACWHIKFPKTLWKDWNIPAKKYWKYLTILITNQFNILTRRYDVYIICHVKTWCFQILLSLKFRNSGGSVIWGLYLNVEPNIFIPIFWYFKAKRPWCLFPFKISSLYIEWCVFIPN